MKSGPDYIQFYPTLRCDRSCDFCFNRVMPAVPDMSAVAFAAMLTVLNHAGVKTIDIMGGEPTLHPDIVEFVAAAVLRGFSVNISSNGSNPDVLDKIMCIGGDVTVGVSVNDRETLERIRGFLQRRRPVVKSVYHPGMDGSLIRDVLSLHPHRFFLIYRDAIDSAGLPDTVSFDRFLQAAQQYDAEQVGTVFCSGFLPDTAVCSESDRVRCPAGTTKLGILPDGSVYPCNLFFNRQEFLLGNIFTVPFTDIWRHPALSFFRSTTPSTCSRTACNIHARCHGGCPAHSYALLHDIARADPRCIRNSVV